jgi:hypothetical protein
MLHAFAMAFKCFWVFCKCFRRMSQVFQMLRTYVASFSSGYCTCESPSLVLVINDTKLLIPCVKCFELGISNACDESVRGKEWWPQDHKWWRCT